MINNRHQPDHKKNRIQIQNEVFPHECKTFHVLKQQVNASLKHPNCMTSYALITSEIEGRRRSKEQGCISTNKQKGQKGLDFQTQAISKKQDK